MKRLERKGLLALALVAGLLAGVPPAGSAEKVMFTPSWIPYGKDVGFFAALGRGYYREVGLDVGWKRGYGAPDTIKRLTVGDIALGYSDPANAALARARGVKVESVAQIMTLSPFSVLVFQDSGIQRPTDLTGRTVSTAPGANIDQTFPIFAESLGIKIGKMIYVEPGAMNATLLSGKSDALLAYGLFHPILSLMAAKMGKKVRLIWWSDYGFKMLGESLVTTDKLIRENPDLVRGFIRATLKGYAWAIDHPREATQYFVKAVPTAKGQIEEQQWKIAVSRIWTPEIKRKGLGHHDFDRVRVTRDLIFKVSGIRKDVPAEEIATNALLPPGPILPER